MTLDYNYNKKDNQFTLGGIPLEFTYMENKAIKQAGAIIRRARSMKLDDKVEQHRLAQEVCGGGDYYACAKLYAERV